MSNISTVPLIFVVFCSVLVSTCSADCVGACVGGVCPTGYMCRGGNVCCSAPTCAAGFACVGGQCPTGYKCGGSNLCCPEKPSYTASEVSCGDFETANQTPYPRPTGKPLGVVPHEKNKKAVSLKFPCRAIPCGFPVRPVYATSVHNLQAVFKQVACVNGACPHGYTCGTDFLCYAN